MVRIIVRYKTGSFEGSDILIVKYIQDFKDESMHDSKLEGPMFEMIHAKAAAEVERRCVQGRMRLPRALHHHGLVTTYLPEEAEIMFCLRKVLPGAYDPIIDYVLMTQWRVKKEEGEMDRISDDQSTVICQETDPRDHVAVKLEHWVVIAGRIIYYLRRRKLEYKVSSIDLAKFRADSIHQQERGRSTALVTPELLRATTAAQARFSDDLLVNEDIEPILVWTCPIDGFRCVRNHYKDRKIILLPLAIKPTL